MGMGALTDKMGLGASMNFNIGQALGGAEIGKTNFDGLAGGLPNQMVPDLSAMG